MSPDNLLQWIKDNKEPLGLVVSAVAAVGTFLTALWKWRTGRKAPVRIRIRYFRLGVLENTGRFVAFEAENISDKTTSLEPTLTLTGYTPDRRAVELTYQLDPGNRQLEPHAARTFSAGHPRGPMVPVAQLWYIKFSLRLTNGKPTTLRFRNVEFQELRRWRFRWELMLFRVLGWVPSGSATVNVEGGLVPASTGLPPGLVAGPVRHPALHASVHRHAVLEMRLTNRSKAHNAVVTAVQAYDRGNRPIPIAWADEIDSVGNPIRPGHIAIDTSAVLYLRHDLGQSIDFARIVIMHDQPAPPLVVVFDELAEWGVPEGPKPNA